MQAVQAGVQNPAVWAYNGLRRKAEKEEHRDILLHTTIQMPFPSYLDLVPSYLFTSAGLLSYNGRGSLACCSQATLTLRQSYLFERTRTMKIITIASAKGGSGKSTLTSAIAVRACLDPAKVAMLDLNFDQGSLTDWHSLRRQHGHEPLPHLDGTEDRPLSERLETLAPVYAWAIIDTPPMDMPAIEEAISLSDFVLAPARCSFFDMAAAQVIASMCRKHSKRYGFAVNCADARHQTVLKQTVTAITGMQWPLLKAQIKYRQYWIQALAVGKTGAEINRDARLEIDDLWTEIKELCK